MNEEDDQKNKDEPTACIHSAPHSTVQHFFLHPRGVCTPKNSQKLGTDTDIPKQAPREKQMPVM